MGKVIMSGIVPQLKDPNALLPSGYAELAYIESTGTQCINTNFIPSSENMKVTLDCMYTASASNRSLFGSQSAASGATRYSIATFGTPQKFNVGGYWACVSFNESINVRYNISAHANNGTFTLTVDGVPTSKTGYGDLDKTVPLALFGNNVDGTVTYLINARIYSCKIHDNGVLVRDFIPCINPSGNIGLYDIVGEKFYGNAGSGVFVGSEVA